MNYPYAKYTMSYQQVVDLDNTIPSLLDFGDETKNANIQKMVMDMYWNWEIAGETIGEFKNMLSHSFGAIKDYYSELIDAYNTKINMLDGIKTTRKTVRDGQNTDTTTLDTTTTNSGGTTNEGYDLPRSNSAENRPSSKTVLNDTRSNKTDGTNTLIKEFGESKTTTMEGGVNVIRLKDQYMKLIRNVYHECALKLQKCFLDIWS